MSDVPLGAFLSGGLDSSAIAALMAQLSDKPVQTFTIGFEESDYSEIEDARVVAKHLGTDHKEIIVRPAAFDILPKLVWHLDEPFGDSSAVPTYYVCEAARRHVTVVLSGDGGDEVFAGYNRYRQLDAYQKLRRVPGWIRRLVLKPLAGRLPFTWPGWNYLHAMARMSGAEAPYRLGIYPHIQEKLYRPELRAQARQFQPFEKTDRLLREAAHLDPVSRYQYLDTLQYLPDDILVKVDRMSMANSLEVRSPLLDYTLVEYMASLPVSLKLQGGVSKRIFRKYCGRLLPLSVLAKRKQGFAIPKRRWFQKERRQYARDLLLDRRTLERGFFKESALRAILDHHASGRRDYSDWIWCLIILEHWMRLFIDRQGEEEMLRETDAGARQKSLAAASMEPGAAGGKGGV
jgi:asparagine synthase (glutamine-hydrolysing)